MDQAPTAAPLRLGVNIDHVATLRNARGGLHRSTSFERFELEPTLEVTP